MQQYTQTHNTYTQKYNATHRFDQVSTLTQLPRMLTHAKTSLLLQKKWLKIIDPVELCTVTNGIHIIGEVKGVTKRDRWVGVLAFLY